MSVKVSGWVWEHAPVKSGELVVLLALADNAHDDGGGAYPSQEHLAEKSRMTGRQVRNCLRSLEEKGVIRKQGTTAKGVVVWRILMGAEDFSGGSQLPSGGGSPLPTEPSGGTARSLERAGAKPNRVSYRGKLVPVPALQTALGCLVAFNESFERKLGAWTAGGTASPHLKQIVGAVMIRPEVTLEEWERAIRNTAANPPGWLNGRTLQIGDVFGERAADHALTNTGVTPERGRARSETNEELAARWLRGE